MDSSSPTSLCLLLLLASMASYSSATWCVCREGVGDAVLQKTLDYACGAGADCNPTHQNGPCFNPNTVHAHCNYAVNSYFQRNHQAATACDFSGAASIVTSDPSTAGCVYPASATAAPVGGGVGGTTTVPNGGGAGGGGGNPLVTGPNNGVLGGGVNGGGLGPSGINNDMSGGTRFGSAVSLMLVAAGGLLVCW